MHDQKLRTQKVSGLRGSSERREREKVTLDDLDRLPPALDLPTAARILGVGRTAAYEMVRDGRWPTPVIRLSSRKIRIPSAPLLDLLGVDRREAS